MKHIDEQNFLCDKQEKDSIDFIPYSEIIQEIYDKEQETFYQRFDDAIERAKGGIKLDRIDSNAVQEKKYGTDQK